MVGLRSIRLSKVLFILICLISSITAIYAQNLQWRAKLESSSSPETASSVISGAVNNNNLLVSLFQTNNSGFTSSVNQSVDFNANFSLVFFNELGEVNQKTDLIIRNTSSAGGILFKQLRIASNDHVYVSGITSGTFDLDLNGSIISIATDSEESKSILVVEFDDSGQYVGYHEIETDRQIYNLFGFEISDSDLFLLSYALIDESIRPNEDEFLLTQYVEFYSSDWTKVDEVNFSARSQNNTAPINRGFLMYGLAVDNNDNVYLSGYMHRGETSNLSTQLNLGSNTNGAVLIKLTSGLDFSWFRAVTSFNATPSAPVIFADNAIGLYINTKTTPTEPGPRLVGATNIFQDRNILGFEGHIMKFNENGTPIWLNSTDLALTTELINVDKYLSISPEDDLYVPMLIDLASKSITVVFNFNQTKQVPIARSSNGSRYYGFQKYTKFGASELLDFSVFQGDQNIRVEPNYSILPYGTCQSFYLIGAFIGAIDLDLGEGNAIENNTKTNLDHFIASYGNETPQLFAEDQNFLLCVGNSISIPFSYSDDELSTLKFSLATSDGSILDLSQIDITFNESSGEIQIPNALSDGNVVLELIVTDNCGVKASLNFDLTYTESPQTPTLNVTESLVELCKGDVFVLASNFNSQNLWSTGETSQSINITQAGEYWVKQVSAGGCESLESVKIRFVFYDTNEQPTITANGPLEFCIGDAVVLTTSLPDGAIWSNGETTESITVTQSGVYTVKQSSLTCGDGPESAAVQVLVSDTTFPPEITVSGNVRFCEGEEVTLISSKTEGNVWSNGETTQSIKVKESGQYWVKTMLDFCQSEPSKTVDILVDQKIDLKLVSDTTICVGAERIELIPEVNNLPNLDYLWSDSSSDQSLFISDKGEYWLQVSNGSCVERALVRVEEACYPVIYAPNAFSPNKDGSNEVFKIFGTRLFSFQISIYNKWGNLVFASKDIDSSWDGTFNGDLAPSGKYIYQIGYQGRIRNQMVNFSQSGSVLLIR